MASETKNAEMFWVVRKNQRKNGADFFQSIFFEYAQEMTHKEYNSKKTEFKLYDFWNIEK